MELWRDVRDFDRGHHVGHCWLREEREGRGHLGDGLCLSQVRPGWNGEGRHLRASRAACERRFPRDVCRARRSVGRGASEIRSRDPALRKRELRAGRDGEGDGLLPGGREGRPLVGGRSAWPRDGAPWRRPRHLLGPSQPAFGEEPSPRGEQGQVPEQGGLGGGHPEAPEGVGIQSARRGLRRKPQASGTDPHGLPLGRRWTLLGWRQSRLLHLSERAPAVLGLPERVPSRLRRMGGLSGAAEVRATSERSLALWLLH